MYGYIYITKNKVNGKFYIGKHRSKQYDPKYLGSGTCIKAAINKYGIENFTNSILDTAETLTELNRKEREYIQKYNAQIEGYNIGPGGDGGNARGWHHTEESKKKISKGETKTKRTDEYNKKISKIQKDIWANKTEEERESFRKKARQRQLGKIPSEETRKKRSETMKEGFIMGKYDRRKGREVWNKGRKLTDEEKEKLGELTRGRIHITNGIINKMIYPEELSEWIDKGFHKGRTINKRRK